MTLFFDDLEVGQSFVSPGRTVTEADVVNFAGVSGDFNQIHMDAVASAKGVFGQRVVHGMLGLSMATGMIDRLGLFRDSMAAMLSIDSWTFSMPIFVGDTIHLKVTIDGLRLTSRGDRGVVIRRMEIINQHGDVVQRGGIKVMILCRSAEQSSEALRVEVGE